MKTFFKKIVVFLGIIAAVSTTSSLVSAPSVSAAHSWGDCNATFAGLVPWDCNVPKDIDNENALLDSVGIIASNVLTDLTIIASYLVLGYVIYGGFLYMSSSGDPAKAAAGKKTLMHAFIGLAITVSAFVIFSGIRVALMGSQTFENCNPLTMQECVSGGDIVTNLIQWVIGIAGAVAVIFVVVGAWGYITASGDANKLAKAKTTILYALIGLAIVAFAEILTAFISGLIKDANEGTTTSLRDTAIVKEIANINKEENEKI